VQRPYPPILLGSHGPHGMQRVIRYCDGWMPNAGAGSNFPGQVAKLRQLAEEAGRDPKTISITAFAAPPDRKTLDEYAAAGAERAVFFLPPAGTDTVMPLLDRYAKLI
jgi:alkanesulfonate monooxygenase SsuD/methylene tetrahydromethanopterin reductase-like flavin-dependent oxidoreductase (luciferase family)